MTEVAMPNYALVAAVLLSVGLGGPSQEKKETEKQTAESKIPPEEAKRENPVKPMAASIAQGKKQYAFDCARCRGSSELGANWRVIRPESWRRWCGAERAAGSRCRCRSWLRTPCR